MSYRERLVDLQQNPCSVRSEKSMHDIKNILSGERKEDGKVYIKVDGAQQLIADVLFNDE